MTTQNHSLWCRGFFATLREGSVWGVPRSGLVFTRRGDRLVLTARMPWSPELAEAAAEGRDVPLDAEALALYQTADFGLIREQFEAAGISVVDGLTDE